MTTDQSPIKSVIRGSAFQTMYSQAGKAQPVDVTVIIPLYNYGHYLINALESLRNQTLGSFDLVIVDDASTDNSCEVAMDWIQSHQARFNRVILAKHTQNQGLSKTRNTAISLSETEYIFPLDPDNELFPRCLEAHLKAITLSRAGFVYCYLEHFGDEQSLGGLYTWNPEKLYIGNTIDAMVMHRKTILEEVQGYSEDMTYGWEDYDLWFKIARLGKNGIRLPEILARYRVHKNSMLITTTNPNLKKVTAYLRTKYPEFFKSAEDINA